MSLQALGLRELRLFPINPCCLVHSPTQALGLRELRLAYTDVTDQGLQQLSTLSQARGAECYWEGLHLPRLALHCLQTQLIVS